MNDEDEEIDSLEETSLIYDNVRDSLEYSREKILENSGKNMKFVSALKALSAHVAIICAELSDTKEELKSTLESVTEAVANHAILILLSKEHDMEIAKKSTIH